MDYCEDLARGSMWTLEFSHAFVLKSDNLQYNTLGRWVAGTNDSSIKHLMFQALFFFKFLIIYFIIIKALKTLYFCKFIKEIKNKLKPFLQRILQEIMKKKYLEHQMVGRRVICPSEPAYHIVDCRISSYLGYITLSLLRNSEPDALLFNGTYIYFNDTRWFEN